MKFWATCIAFLGIELDTVKMEARLPQEKIQKRKLALDAVKKCKKITLRNLQSLIGLLNFACCVVVLGRAFLQRLINLTMGVSKLHSQIRLNNQARFDLEAWSEFINSFNGKSIFLNDEWQNSEKLHTYTDAADSLGYGAVLGKKCFMGTGKKYNYRTIILRLENYFPLW